jgi:hypothetical protein
MLRSTTPYSNQRMGAGWEYGSGGGGCGGIAEEGTRKGEEGCEEGSGSVETAGEGHLSGGRSSLLSPGF